MSVPSGYCYECPDHSACCCDLDNSPQPCVFSPMPFGLCDHISEINLIYTSQFLVSRKSPQTLFDEGCGSCDVPIDQSRSSQKKLKPVHEASRSLLGSGVAKFTGFMMLGTILLGLSCLSLALDWKYQELWHIDRAVRI